jgi:hypothetical protein
MGGSVGKVVAVAAAVAVPFAAPTISASLGLSSAINTAVGAAAGSAIGTVAGSAITGAALGAVTATVTGQPISRGAIVGGITGGLGGFFNTPTTGDITSASGQVGRSLPSVPEVGLSTASPADAVFGTVPTSVTPNVGAGLTTADLGISPVLGAGRQFTAATSQTAIADLGTDLTDTLRSTGSKVLSKVTSPDALASLTVQAVGQLTAAALVPDAGLPGFSPEEQELVAARRQELEELRVRDNAAYEQQIALSKQLLTQAGYVDPTYFANQARNQAAILGARQQRDLEDERAFNPLIGDFTTADKNRMSIERARQQQSAFDTGFLKGIDLQGQLLTDAARTIPSSPTAYSVGLDRLQDDLAIGRTLADTQRKNIAGLTSTLNTTSGRDQADEENLQRITQNTITGLNTDTQNYLDNRFDMSFDDEELKNQLTGRT